jgi:hypothetical protein
MILLNKHYDPFLKRAQINENHIGPPVFAACTNKYSGRLAKSAREGLQLQVSK